MKKYIYIYEGPQCTATTQKILHHLDLLWTFDSAIVRFLTDWYTSCVKKLSSHSDESIFENILSINIDNRVKVFFFCLPIEHVEMGDNSMLSPEMRMKLAWSTASFLAELGETSAVERVLAALHSVLLAVRYRCHLYTKLILTSKPASSLSLWPDWHNFSYSMSRTSWKHEVANNLLHHENIKDDRDTLACEDFILALKDIDIFAYCVYQIEIIVVVKFNYDFTSLSY